MTQTNKDAAMALFIIVTGVSIWFILMGGIAFFSKMLTFC